MSEPSPVSSSRAYKLLHQMLALHESEIDCETCADSMDCLADLLIEGRDAAQVWQACQKHLDCCRECREEFEALIAILRMEQAGSGNEALAKRS